MCFNAEVSLFTFMLGTLFSIILIKYGNKQFKIENLATGIFFIFISEQLQFLDYYMEIDIRVMHHAPRLNFKSYVLHVGINVINLIHV